jgi:hypothetical protein
MCASAAFGGGCPVDEVFVYPAMVIRAGLGGVLVSCSGRTGSA